MDDDDDSRAAELEVLSENWDAVQVFTRCSHQYIAGLGGACSLGFTALEIDAACNLYGLAPEARQEVSEHVRQMGAIAAQVLNSRKA